MADHPRIRGEHDRLGRLRDQPLGSSPHTRGARVEPHAGLLSRRIIPAYAGSTAGPGRRRGARADHPRIRGEHPRTIRAPDAPPGSSPHTRGARGCAHDCRGRAGIIPAYAGSTARESADATWVEDHPRIRGEHDRLGRLRDQPLGSSPHTRGALHAASQVLRAAGIIPAYAGSTGAPVGRAGSVGDHPRIRGEHVKLPPIHLRSGGSSPHTRGAPVVGWPGWSRGGIIPAYAGSTGRWTRYACGSGDHPRIRGEHVHIEAPGCPQMGSSPHTRGAPSRSSAICFCCTDHPRIRGEHIAED